LGSNMGTTPN